MDYCFEKEIPWTQVCNGVEWKKNENALLYDVRWIPTFYLINPDCEIQGICFTAKELGKMLAELDL